MKNQRPRFWKVVSGSVMAALIVAMLAVQPAAAQAEDQEVAMNYSLYYENFKNENYEAALPNLRWILENAPAFRGDDRNFERGVETYEALAEAAQDEATAKAYLDSALVLIEEAVPTLEEASAEVDPYEWKLRKGRFLQTHADAYPDRQAESLAAYREAYELAPEEIDPYYIERIIRAYLPDDKEGAITFMDEVEATRGEDEEVAEVLDEWRNRVFTDPEERIAYLERELEDEPENVEIMSELFDLYVQEEYPDRASQLAPRLLELEPSARIYRLVARMHLDDGQPQEAFEMYQQAVEMSEEEVSAEVYYNMGLAQQQMDQLAEARTYFRRAIEVDPEFGQAYLAIGDLYARAVSQCGGGQMERTDQAVYWLAVDYYQRAKSADPSVASTADQKISTYRQYFPNQEALFFNNWEPGQSYQIDYGCYAWIGETTTVKSPA